MRHLQTNAPRRAQGAILIITLMFLVLLTIVGIASISTATLEEKMAGNTRDQATAFQAAESALRDAEMDLEPGIGGAGNRDAAINVAYFGTLCSAAFTNGVCMQPSPLSSPAGAAGTYQTEIVTVSTWNWTNTDKTVAYGTYTGAVRLCASDAACTPTTLPVAYFRQPRYVIEYLPEKDNTGTIPTTRHFRITARGWGASENTTVTLQTIYRMGLN